MTPNDAPRRTRRWGMVLLLLALGGGLGLVVRAVWLVVLLWSLVFWIVAVLWAVAVAVVLAVAGARGGVC